MAAHRKTRYLTIGSLFVVLMALSSAYIVTSCGGGLVSLFAFHPEPGVQVSPDSISAPVDTVYLDTEDGVRISGFYLSRPKSDAAVLYLHGNAGNASHRLPDAEWIWSMGINVFLLDYRGFGLSEGSPSEAGVYLDARAGLSFIEKEKGISQDRIAVVGRSIGSAVATDLAAEEKVAGLVLVSPFTSGRAMAERGGVGSLLSDEDAPFDTISKISNVRSPLLVIHGTMDSMIPVEMGRLVFDAANEPKRFAELPGVGHNDISQVEPERYFGIIEGFLAELDMLPVSRVRE